MSHRTNIKHRIKHRILTPIIFGILTFLTGFIFPRLIESVVGIGYFIKFESVEVNNLSCRDWNQSIAITRRVRDTILGEPYQELYLYEKGGDKFIYKTEKIIQPAIYEASGNELVLYTRDWKTKIPLDILENLDRTKQYYWVWQIEPIAGTKFFKDEPRRFDPIRIRTNNFKIEC